MTFGSIYSGVGGADAGFAGAGWDIKVQVEADPFRQQVLKRNFGVPVYGDVSTVDGGGPVEMVYIDMPDWRIDKWWGPAYRAAKLWDPQWILIEVSPTVRFEAMIRDLALDGWAFRVLHYRYEVVTKGQPEELSDIRNRGYVLAAKDQADLDALGLASNFIHIGFKMSETTYEAHSVPWHEVTRGLRGNWTCVCGQDPCACDKDARMNAVTDATCPLLTHWLAQVIDGRWQDGRERQTTAADGTVPQVKVVEA